MSVEMPTKFLPAFFVDVVPLDAKYLSGELPYHISLFPPVEQPYQNSIRDPLRAEVHTLAPFGVVTGEEDWFGPNNDTHVRRVETSQRLKILHKHLVRVLGVLLHDPQYRQPYNPHITDVNGVSFPENKTILVGGLSIVEKVQGGAWVVKDKIALKGTKS